MKLELHPNLDSLWMVQCDAHIKTPKEVGDFLESNKEIINDGVKKGMSFYFKGFPITNSAEYENALKKLNPHFLAYTGAKVRKESELSSVLYQPTSTPGFRKNFLHNEMAYQPEIPPVITVFCEQPGIGGETLLGDQRSVWNSIRADYREKLITKKLKFVRTLVCKSRLHDFMSKNFDFMATFPSWQNNFNTTDREEVRNKLTGAGFEVEWTEKNDLIFSCVIDPIKLHPETGEKMWVNNSHLFQLHPKVYGRFLYSMFKMYLSTSSRPMTTCLYGDGEKIEPEVISNILEATNKNEVSIALKKGEFIYANNWTCGHGRKTFSGKRRLYFGLLTYQ